MAVVGPAPTVFVSHATEDREVASRIAEGLTRRGVVARLAMRDMPGGATYAAWIAEQIASCDAFVIVLSTDSLASKHVAREMNLAVDSERPVVPIATDRALLADGALAPEWRYWLGTVQVVPLDPGLTALDHVIRVVPQPTAVPSQNPVPTAPAPPSPRSAVSSSVRSLLIRAGLKGLTVSQIRREARRLGVPQGDIAAALEDLREAKLISFQGAPEDDVVVRLT